MAVVDGQHRAALPTIRLAMSCISAADVSATSSTLPRAAAAVRAGCGFRRQGRRRGRHPAPRPTSRSHQPLSVRTNWRRGRASKNSFATNDRRAGRDVRRGRRARPAARRPGPARALRARAGPGWSRQGDRAALRGRPGSTRRRAQRVGHQRAASGSQLDKPKLRRRAHPRPRRRRTRARAVRRTSG